MSFVSVSDGCPLPHHWFPTVPSFAALLEMFWLSSVAITTGPNMSKVSCEDLVSFDGTVREKRAVWRWKVSSPWMRSNCPVLVDQDLCQFLSVQAASESSAWWCWGKGVCSRSFSLPAPWPWACLDQPAYLSSLASVFLTLLHHLLFYSVHISAQRNVTDSSGRPIFA